MFTALFWLSPHTLFAVDIILFASFRFVIKSIIDKASVGDVEEDCPEAINLLATVEHILNHHAKGDKE